jgi:hypothetical protein
MHVGYGCYFQNPGGRLPDAEVYRQELRLAEMAEPLGFDSIWSGGAKPAVLRRARAARRQALGG